MVSSLFTGYGIQQLSDQAGMARVRSQDGRVAVGRFLGDGNTSFFEEVMHTLLIPILYGQT